MANTTLPQAPSELVSPERAAEILSVATGTLSVWRCTRRVHIPFVRIGHAVRYRLSDLDRYIEAHTVGAPAAE
jgi:hypothetical protein